MRVAGAVGSIGLDARWTQKKDRNGWTLVRILWRVSRQPPESLEAIIARAIDQAFAEFAKEMAG